jgi:hypothetical protein
MAIILMSGAAFIRCTNGRTEYPSTKFYVISLFGTNLFRKKYSFIL